MKPVHRRPPADGPGDEPAGNQSSTGCRSTRRFFSPSSETGNRRVWDHRCERPYDRLAVDVTTKELMARIGHSSPRAALIYQHATAERDRAVAAYLDEVVASVEQPPRAPVVDLNAATRGAGAGLTVPKPPAEAATTL